MKKRPLLAALCAAAALVLLPTSASALSIESEGPLTTIDISATLNCAVNHSNGEYGEFYSTAEASACGTFVAAGGALYGPSKVPASNAGSKTTAWTEVSQEQAGAGTPEDPFTITTVVEGGSLRVTQQDHYVSGENFTRTTATVTNTGGSEIEATLYRAADCYLGNSDRGYGAYDDQTGAVRCAEAKSADGSSDASRIIEFIPDTPGSKYQYSRYSEIWSAVGSMQPFPSEMRNADEAIDNGIGLSWTETIPANGSVSFDARTNFSPLGVEPLTTSLDVSTASATSDGVVAVQATVENPNEQAQSLVSAQVTLPEGVAYVDASAAGPGTVETAEGVLKFSQPGLIPGQQSVTFSFELSAAAAGEYPLEFSAALASRAEVVPCVAQLTVPGGEPVVDPGEGDAPEQPTKPATPTTPGGTQESAPASSANNSTAPGPRASSSTPGQVLTYAYIDPLKAAEPGISTAGITTRNTETREAAPEQAAKHSAQSQASAPVSASPSTATAASNNGGSTLSLALLIGGVASGALLLVGGAIGISASRRAAGAAAAAATIPVAAGAAGTAGTLRDDIIAALGLAD